MDTSDAWIRERTGIEQRRWVESESCADLATSTPDHYAPGVGVFVQRNLAVPNIPALDVRTQCSGFVYALSVADAWIRVGMYRRILVIGAEVQSTGMDVKYVESRDGHNWENWRDRLREGLSWLFPGPQLLVYE